MHDRQLYEYAVIRVVPKVEREEFLNVGIVLFCKKAKYINVKFKVDAERLLSFSKDLDVDELNEYLNAFEKITLGQKDCGKIAQFDIPERFRWLTSIRSSILQTSRPHPGLSNDLQKTLDRLFEELVA